MTQPTPRVPLAEAIFLGLGSMVGAGAFIVWSPVLPLVGEGIWVSLVIAALAAFCHAVAAAQIAARSRLPAAESSGQDGLGAIWGFLGAWGFVVSGISGAAVMAKTLAAYLTPGGWSPQLFGILVVVLLAAAAYRGVSLTLAATRGITVIVVGVLLALAVTNEMPATPGDMTSAWSGRFLDGYGLLQAGGLVFFAFIGYTRMAALSRVTDRPSRSIPWAILAALVATVALYGGIGQSLLNRLNPRQLITSAAPLMDAAAAGPYPMLIWVARIGVALAVGAALLSVLAGTARTVAALADNRDLPRILTERHLAYRTPYVALAVLTVAISLLIGLPDDWVSLRFGLGLASAGILFAAWIANLAAFRQEAARFSPRALQLAGLVLSSLLLVTLPWQALLVAAMLVGLGAATRTLTRVWPPGPVRPEVRR
ncbi:MAG: APC family permease [Propioniciclava sp.]